MKFAPSLNKKQMAELTSASVPKRFRGTASLKPLIHGFKLSGYESIPLDATQPGATALTRTPDAPHSTAAV